MEDASKMERMLQIGKVSAVDTNKHKVRVLFSNTGITSDWLSVLRNAPKSGTESASGHSHKIKDWMPAVNDTVVVLYLPSYNSDGFVLGGV